MHDPINLTKARWAVITFFSANGFLFASWSSRLPEIERFYNITHTQLGSILFTSAIGSVIAMPFAGYLNNIWGSRNTTILTGILLALILPIMVVYPSLYLLYPIFFIIGMVNGSMDVSMNGQAVAVERSWGKSIMSFFHATFSIGMVVGAGCGALATQLGLSLIQHIIIAAVVSLIAIIWASGHLIDDRQEAKSSIGNSPGFMLPTAAILPIAVIGFCGMAGEGSLVDWSALYMNEIIGSSEAMSAIAYGTFGGAMTLGRLYGDRFTDRIGGSKMLLIESLLSIIGLAIAIIFATKWMTLIGFFIAGIGLSNIVPIIYSKAGNTPGVKPAVGIAMATTIGYAGFFIGPPIIGFLADIYDLRIALCFTLILFAVMTTIIWKKMSSLN